MSSAPQLRIDWKPKLPEKTDFGIGVIGAGFVAMDYHLPGYAKAGFRVVAVADVREEAALAAQSRFGIPHAFTDYRRILDLPEIDIVDILTPRPVRLQIVRDAAAAGKHIMSQKPLASTYAEAKAMVEATEASGVRMGVHLHYRWLPAYRGAWVLLRQAYIGQPLLMTHRMVGNQDAVYYEDPRRRWNAEIDDFLLVEWGAHQMDFLRFWAAQRPVRVFASTTRAVHQNFRSDMIATVVAEFAGGARGVLLMDQVQRASEGLMDFRIEGSAGAIVGSNFVQLAVARAGETLRPVALDIPPTFMEVVHLSYVGTMSEMFWALVEGRDPASSARDHLHTVAMCEAAVISAREGRAVEIAEVEQSS
ncbi:MAG: Gfo/Idh/MocA family oxidoreductase [Armatimonadetes bacterium]|nr:Gfo/Idh/MocA family oxidoreductase [Armatimonadota bacterium]